MRKRYPGKFEGCADDRMAQVLYDMTLNGGCDGEIGSVDELGWYGFIRHRKLFYLVSEDSNGFFEYEVFDSEKDFSEAWAGLEEAYTQFYQENIEPLTPAGGKDGG